MLGKTKKTEIHFRAKQIFFPSIVGSWKLQQFSAYFPPKQIIFDPKTCELLARVFVVEDAVGIS